MEEEEEEEDGLEVELEMEEREKKIYANAAIEILYGSATITIDQIKKRGPSKIFIFREDLGRGTLFIETQW